MSKTERIEKGQTRAMVFEVEEHHSAMGTSIYFLPLPASQYTHGYVSPFDGFNLDARRGDRYKVTIERVKNSPTKRPRKNPWR